MKCHKCDREMNKFYVLNDCNAYCVRCVEQVEEGYHVKDSDIYSDDIMRFTCKEFFEYIAKSFNKISDKYEKYKSCSDRDKSIEILVEAERILALLRTYRDEENCI